MQLTKKQIEDFKELHAKHGGLSYTDGEIVEIATGLVNYFSTLIEIVQRIQKTKGNRSLNS